MEGGWRFMEVCGVGMVLGDARKSGGRRGCWTRRCADVGAKVRRESKSQGAPQKQEPDCTADTGARLRRAKFRGWTARRYPISWARRWFGSNSKLT